MRSKQVKMWVAFFIILLTIDHLVFASISVIAGSSGISPPPFWEDSFWGMTPSIERAFPFTVIPGGPYFVEDIEVAAWHYEGMAGSTVFFSINVDNEGKPGDALATIKMTGITTSQQVVSTTFTEEVILNSNSVYWLVGGTQQGQVNWSLGENVFGTAAYRVNQGVWTILSNSNVSAYAILGSPVPEPATLLLLGLGGLTLLRKRRV
jgi:hypothetical protein